MGSESKDRSNQRELAEVLFAEWAVRFEAGNVDTLDDLVAAHPGIADELTRLHGDWLKFAPLLRQLVPGTVVLEECSGADPGLDDTMGDGVGPDTDLLRLEVPGGDRYRFRGVLGRGGGGAVLKVWDSQLQRPLAMKIVMGVAEDYPSGPTRRLNKRMLARFIDEARIASQLAHPGIVPVHEVGSDGAGRLFFTMKLVRGDDLRVVFDRVHRREPDWTIARALGLLLRACEAMAYAHDKGVIHRDLKPGNVMVGRFGEVHVMDWGLARVLGRSGTPDWDPATITGSLGERSEGSPLATMEGPLCQGSCRPG